MICGDRLKALRKSSGLTADQVAARLEMGRAQLLKYENGKTDPSTNALLRLAGFYGVSTDYLLGVSDVATVRQNFASVKIRVEGLPSDVEIAINRMCDVFDIVEESCSYPNRNNDMVRVYLTITNH